ncbi:MAG: hypothetical protein JRJ03_09435 [Deltaproteobacteria bacterium]|nr:hypothetical protein [Deltaproteobacteria bacterium]
MTWMSNPIKIRRTLCIQRVFDALRAVLSQMFDKDVHVTKHIGTIVRCRSVLTGTRPALDIMNVHRENVCPPKTYSHVVNIKYLP